MNITKDTKVHDILAAYGDIADVMAVFGIKPVGPYSLRRVITRFLTVERAAKIHKVPTDQMVDHLNEAIKRLSSSS